MPPAPASTPPADEAEADLRLLRPGAASIWLLTGLLVLHPHYRAIGAPMLADLGLPAWLMWATCGAEVALGAAVALGSGALSRASGRPRVPLALLLAATQLALVLGFTAILAAKDPMLLASPYGVLTKNVPLLAVVVTTFLLERDGRWTPRALWTLRAGMAAIWVTEGLIPKVLFQQPAELAVVRGSGLVPLDAAVFLRGMGLCQVASGALALLLRGRALVALLACQLAALVVLPVLVSWQDPLLWVHPFGPMTKNLPILAGTFVALRRARAAA